MNMNTSNYNILVLTDFSEASTIALRNAAKLVKMVDGNIHAFYVHPIKPSAEEENQLSLKRRMRDSYRQISAKSKKNLSTIEEEEGVTINFSMDWGNVKTVIKKRVQETNPDLVILGRRKPSKLLSFMGDKVTQYVIDHCATSILISSSNQELHSFSNLSLGFYGETIEKSDFKIIDHLQESHRSVKYFGIRTKSPVAETKNSPEKSTNSFMFPQDSSNAIEALSSYVLRTNTQLFCIPKENNLKPQPVRELVKQLDIPILLYK